MFSALFFFGLEKTDMAHRLRILFFVVVIAALVAGPASAQDPTVDEETLVPLRLTIEKAVELALTHNEAVRVADEAINEAKGAYMEYAADAFPQISGVAGYTRYLERRYTEVDMTAFNPLLAQFGQPPLEVQKSYFNRQHEWDFRLMATQNIFTFGKVTNAIRLGSVYKKIAKESKQITVKDVALHTRQAFLRVLFLRESLKVAQSNLELVRETHAVVVSKTQQGVMSKFDLLVVESELAAAEPQLLRAQRDLQTATQALLNVIGEPLDRETIIVGDLAIEKQSYEATMLVKQAKLQRPALRALQLQEDLHETTYKLSRSLYLPTLSANATYAQSGGTDKQIWPDDPSEDLQPTLSFGLQLYVPIFDGLNAAGKMKQAAARQHTSRLQFLQTSRAIELEVTSLVSRIEVTRRILESNSKSVQVAEEANRLAQLRFENGLGTRLEVSDARNQLNLAKLGLAGTLYELNDARAQLRRALGQ
jgi:outer membrane protein